MREHWLVGKAGDYTIAIDAGNVLRGEDRGDPRMRGHEAIQIAKLESRAMIRTAHDTYSQSGLGTFIRSKDFCAVNFLLAVEADQPRPHRRTGLRRKLLAVDIHFLNRANDLAISRTAAEHSANRVHHFLLGWRRVLSSSAVADTSIPGVQAPHCAAPWTRKEVCKRLCMGDRLARPSTVVTSHPATCPAATRQAHTGSPSSNTVQAPQSPASQPTFVPVRPRSSRNTRERRRLPVTLTSTLRPLMEKEMSCDSIGDVGVCVATSGSPHTSLQRSPDQRNGGIPPVLGRCADVVNGR
jgi:hypothetical protein